MRQKIAVVPQELFLYDMSIKDNICIGKQDASLDEIKQVAEMADIDSFVEGLPEKYDTEIGQRGIKLSQGQRQRIAIARALIKKTSLIVLNELLNIKKRFYDYWSKQINISVNENRCENSNTN